MVLAGSSEPGADELWLDLDGVVVVGQELSSPLEMNEVHVARKVLADEHLPASVAEHIPERLLLANKLPIYKKSYLLNPSETICLVILCLSGGVTKSSEEKVMKTWL